MKAEEVVLSSLIVYLRLCACSALTNIPAYIRENVTLTCQAPNNIQSITTLEWSRPELDPEYVLRYQYGRLDPINQHPSYQNRVDLQDKEMKDGNFSMVLKDVTMEDRGRYHCRVFQGNNEPICSINLEVHPSRNKDGVIGNGGNKNGPIVGPVVGVILSLLAVTLLVL